MPVINRLAEMLPEISAWRRDIHAHPELRFQEHRTAALVALKLKEFGCDEVVTGFGETGVVGVIHGKSGAAGKTIGFRADMDALPIEEATNLPHTSTVPGKMHACGHAITSTPTSCIRATKGAVIGEEFCNLFAQIKQAENQEYQREISPWERQHLLLNV